MLSGNAILVTLGRQCVSLDRRLAGVATPAVQEIEASC
jgi:hypothetical protein